MGGIGGVVTTGALCKHNFMSLFIISLLKYVHRYLKTSLEFRFGCGYCQLEHLC
jgi:hypothetical protein